MVGASLFFMTDELTADQAAEFLVAYRTAFMARNIRVRVLGAGRRWAVESALF